MATPSFEGPPVPAAFVADVLGVHDPERKKHLERLVPALTRISEDLVPRVLDHAYAEEIQRGAAAVPDLLGAFRAAKREADRVIVLDALCQVLDREPAPKEAVEALEKILAGTKSPAILSMAARALATAGYTPFLEQQRAFLASDRPSELRRSARLLGYGRYAPAVPALLALLRPDRAGSLDAVVWALGEIGDERAVPALHAMLERFVQVEPVLDALGKIGARVSVMRALPVLLEGAEPQRAAAARALARIAQAHDGDLESKDLARSVRESLEKVIEADASPRARFFALVAYARLDGHLEPSRILAALGGGLREDEVDGAAKLLRRGPKPKPRGGRRGRKLI